ncbi:MAG: hypothetical protein H0X37_09415 [Herpetosiphonaceae bacterium]|nr:hypothetical protein [Herpetosiphonaceae bacterium]
MNEFGQGAPPVSTLVAIRAAAHAEGDPPYERVVWEFSGPVPLINVQYVTQLLGGGSGLPVPITGNAILEVTMTPAQAHDDQGQATAPAQVNFNLPNLKQVVSGSDFEGVLSYGVGLDHKTEIRVITLAGASRVVIDFLNP